MPFDPEAARSSRGRLLAAGKTLFARFGYEQTSTAAIAREAGTSESQLVRYFEGKSGLLEAIFNESWKPLNQRVQTLIASAAHGRDAVLGVLSTIINGFGNDPELAFIFLFEGRRVRGGGHEVILSKGFLQFTELVRRLVARGQKDGSFSGDFDEVAVTSALMGAAEGMIRDRLIAARSGKANPFSEREIRRVFAAVLEGLSAFVAASGEGSPLAKSV